jgi:hypothetical protein
MKMGMLTLIAFSHFEVWLIWACAAVTVLPPLWMIAREVRLAMWRRRRAPAEVIELDQRRRARQR